MAAVEDGMATASLKLSDGLKEQAAEVAESRKFYSDGLLSKKGMSWRLLSDISSRFVIDHYLLDSRHGVPLSQGWNKYLGYRVCRS